MMRRWTLLTLIILSGVGVGTLALSARREPASLPKESSGPVPIPVEVTTVQRGEISESIDVVGSLSPKRVAAVHSEYPGIIEQVMVLDWVEVKEGDVLAKLDTREVEARVARCAADLESSRADILKNEAFLHHASREYERVTTLNDAHVVTERSHDEAVRARDMALAELAGCKARLQMSEQNLREAHLQMEKSEIRSPIAGIVSARNAQVGERVDGSGAGKPLFEIVDNKLLDLILSVPSTSLAKVRVDQAVNFTTDVYPGKVFSAQIKFINPRADAVTRAVSILAEVQNSTGELKDGLFVKGNIETSRRSDVLLLPQVSVLSEQVQAPVRYVFVVTDEKVHRQPVETGASVGDSVEIVKGLEGHEQVVTRGAFLLRDGDRVIVETTSSSLAKAEAH
jgi:membrane fusion protein, multidrug efflux system